jgi:CRP/FNR family transcriptional regulator, nitrogen fixation regulation protein
VFGLQIGDARTFSADAITDCNILIIKRAALVSLAGRNSAVIRQLWGITAAELQRAQDHAMLLIKTAQERVAGFLLEMTKLSAVAAAPGQELPVWRPIAFPILPIDGERPLHSLYVVAQAPCLAPSGWPYCGVRLA